MYTKKQTISMNNGRTWKDENILPKVSGDNPANIIPRKKRIMKMLALTPDPHHFHYGSVGVTVEFVDDGPTLQNTLTDFLIRQKSGL
jgi:hypothetical protein